MVTEQRELIARLEQDLSTIQSIQRPDAEVSPLYSLPPHHPLRAPSLGWACSLHLEAQFGQRQASSTWHKHPQALAWTPALGALGRSKARIYPPISQPEDLRPKDHGRLEPKGPWRSSHDPPHFINEEMGLRRSRADPGHTAAWLAGPGTPAAVGHQG